jgi:hypothetical protein
MAENSNTAERELLKAIEGEKVNLTKRKPFLESIKSKFTLFAVNISPKIGFDTISDKLTIHNVNKVLMFLAACFLFWWTIVFFNGVSRFKDIKQLDQIDSVSSLPALKFVESEIREYAYYIDTLLSRNIFNPAKQSSQDSDAAESTSKIASNLRMVGISWSDERGKRYAMVEDVLNKITYYVQEGDFIQEFIIKEIGEKQIVLSHKGNEVRLQ